MYQNEDTTVLFLVLKSSTLASPCVIHIDDKINGKDYEELG